MVTVHTTRYEASHCRAPRGYGSWAFETRSGEIIGWFKGTYAEARKAAKTTAKAHGIGEIYACP